MMLHYAHVLPVTIKKEIDALHKQKKIVAITGAEVEILHLELDNDIGLQWLRSNMQPLALAIDLSENSQKPVVAGFERCVLSRYSQPGLT